MPDLRRKPSLDVPCPAFLSGKNMDDANLRADCSRCAGLCCVAYPFDRSEQFAYDKAGDEPCRHLTPSFRCSIHAERAHREFAGCARYECFGAGQMITDLYDGRSWRDSPGQASEMFEVFRILRRVHELVVVLRAAAKLSLPPSDSLHCRAFEDILAPPAGWTAEALRAFKIDTVSRDVHAFLMSLKRHIANEGA
jgi:hypothetical protein